MFIYGYGIVYLIILKPYFTIYMLSDPEKNGIIYDFAKQMSHF